MSNKQLELTRSKLYKACRKQYSGAIDYRTVSEGWKRAFLRLGFNPLSNAWEI